MGAEERGSQWLHRLTWCLLVSLAVRYNDDDEALCYTLSSFSLAFFFFYLFLFLEEDGTPERENIEGNGTVKPHNGAGPLRRVPISHCVILQN